MKKQSINKVNGRISQHPTILAYNELSKGNNRNYRNRYFKFKMPGWNDTSSLTPTGNFIYGGAMKAIALIMGENQVPSTRRETHTLYFSERRYVDFRLCLVVNTFGVYISAQVDYCNFLKNGIWKVKSSETFDQLNIVAYFKEHILPKYYFAPGLFRNMQLLYNIPKDKVAAKYKEVFHPEFKNIPDPKFSRVKALERRLNKKLNIQTDALLPEKKLIAAFKQFKRQKHKTNLQTQPSPFYLLEDLSWEFDTEEEIMEAAENILTDTKTLFI